MTAFVLATRRSTLALRQSEAVAAALRAAHAGLPVELLPLSTRGDELLDRSLAPLGGKGLFVKALEQALERGRARAAVHSLKDVPAVLEAGFALAAVTTRADPRDVLVARAGGGLESLRRGARVGTSSLRRQAQLLAVRPDLEIVAARGSVETRLARVDAEEVDAVVLAAAGMARLDIRRGEPLAPEIMLPASGQGALAVEIRGADADAAALVAALEDPASRIAALAERAFCRTLGASCAAPVAAYATVRAGSVSLAARVAAADGTRILAGVREGPAREAAALGNDLARELLGRGAGPLIGRNDGTA